MPTPLTTKLQQLADGVQARLRKEIARAGTDTELVGGLTKLGNEFEGLLKCAADLVCQNRKVSLTRQMSGRSSGSGTYARVIGDLVRTGAQITAPPLLGRIVADIKKPRSQSALYKLIEIRNSNNHPTTQPLDRSRIINIMASAEQVLATP